MQGEPTWNWICTELSPSPTPALQIERLREEGSRQLEEQQRLIREQIRQEQEQRLRGKSLAPTPATHSEVAHSGHTGCSVKLIWEASTCWNPPGTPLGHMPPFLSYRSLGLIGFPSA